MPRFQFAAPQELWDAFKDLHGERQASARLRHLIAQDLAAHHAAALGSRSETQHIAQHVS